jgi:hypothetical protein
MRNFLDSFPKEVVPHFMNNKIISISGKSGAGKTTLAIQVVGDILRRSVHNEGSCVWIQASEIFPKKRLFTLFQDNLALLNYLKNNIYCIPINKIYSSYDEQSNNLFRIINEELVFPPYVKTIVIDNVSHHLRYRIHKMTKIKEITNLLDGFFNTQLFPLIMFCNFRSIKLVLIHEMTDNVNSGKTHKFFNSLYKRIETFDIILKKKLIEKKNIMNISYNQEKLRFNYEIFDSGLILMSNK